MGLLTANPQPKNRIQPFPRRTCPPLQMVSKLQRSHDVDTGNLNQRMIGGVATVFHSATPPIHSCSAQKTSRKTGECRRTHHSDRRSPLQATPLPRCRRQPQPHPTTDNGVRDKCRSRPTSRLAQWPVSPFVVVFSITPPTSASREIKMCPAPPVNTPTSRDCLAAIPPGSAHSRNHVLTQLLLRPHSQTSAFDTYPTKGTHRRPSRPLKSFLR